MTQLFYTPEQVLQTTDVAFNAITHTENDFSSLFAHTATTLE